MTSRPIAAIDLAPGLVPGQPPTARPELAWLDPRELLVDESYQRGIGDKGRRLIEKIVTGFDWRRFKPPTAVWTAAGLEVLDGQHSAIAAATHPDIDTIPVIIVEAEEIATRADAFVGINRDRLAMSALELHAAAVVSGDPAAVAIERVCAACGVTVRRAPPSHGAYEPRDTVAVRAVGDLIRRVGEPLAIEVLRVLADAELTPIDAAALRAVEVLLTNPEYADQAEPARLSRAIAGLGAAARKEAAVFAGTHGVPRWRGLVAIWFQEAKKRPRRESAAADAGVPALPARRVIIRRLPNGSVSLGDPAPGRSALDQARREVAS